MLGVGTVTTVETYSCRKLAPIPTPSRWCPSSTWDGPCIMPVIFLSQLHLGRSQLPARPNSPGTVPAVSQLHLGPSQLPAHPNSHGTVPVVSQLHLGRSHLPARPNSTWDATTHVGRSLQCPISTWDGRNSSTSQLTCDGPNSTWDVRNFQHVPTHLGRSLQCPNCTWDGRDWQHFPTPLETCSVSTPLGTVTTS